MHRQTDEQTDTHYTIYSKDCDSNSLVSARCYNLSELSLYGFHSFQWTIKFHLEW